MHSATGWKKTLSPCDNVRIENRAGQTMGLAIRLSQSPAHTLGGNCI
jgi:hypothetical protein